MTAAEDVDGWRRAVVPGSFDPVTRGHVDVIGRAVALFDEVIVAVGRNSAKNALLGPAERIELLEHACAAWPSVTVTSFDGLLVDLCRQRSAMAVVKGVRSPGDVEHELPMAQMNVALAGIETVLLPTAPAWSFVSSSLVREVARLGGDVTGYVPQGVAERVAARVAANR